MAVNRHTLLIDRVLSFRDTSPLIAIEHSQLQAPGIIFSLVLDRARKAGFNIVHVCLQGRKALGQNDDLYFDPLDHEVDLNGLHKVPLLVLNEVRSKFRPSGAKDESKFIFAIDSLEPILLQGNYDVPSFLASFMTMPNISLIYSFSSDMHMSQPDEPQISNVLGYMATSIIKVSSLPIEIEEHKAKAMALPPPVAFDMASNGVVLPFGSNSLDYYVEFEHRRKSGRPIVEKYIYRHSQQEFKLVEQAREFAITVANEPQKSELDGLDDMTFNMRLTEEQKAMRDRLKLPHFAMQDVGDDENDKGGTIYYTPDSADDYDEEEADEDLLP